MEDDGVMLGKSVAERLAPLLFSREGVRLTNIKFFRGEKAVIAVEEFLEEVHSALTQARLGTAVRSDSFAERTESRPWREILTAL